LPSFHFNHASIISQPATSPKLAVAVCKDLDSVWVWLYKDVAPTAL